MSRSIFAPDPTPDGGFRLTGRHVLIIFLAFFGVVFVVNGVMMRAALTTFSGLEAENPYKEGLAFNQRLADSRAQELRAWSVDASVTRAADGQAAVAVAAFAPSPAGADPQQLSAFIGMAVLFAAGGSRIWSFAISVTFSLIHLGESLFHQSPTRIF